MRKDNIVYEEELVYSPEHYQGKVEAIDYIEDKLSTEEYKGFLKGSILKYLSRMGRKGHAVTDAKKARWYLERLVELLEECESKRE